MRMIMKKKGFDVPTVDSRAVNSGLSPNLSFTSMSKQQALNQSPSLMKLRRESNVKLIASSHNVSPVS